VTASDLGQGFTELALLLKFKTQVNMDLSDIGLEPDRFAVLGHRLRYLPLTGQGQGEVVVGHGVVGLEPDDLPKLGDRLGQLTLTSQGRAELGVGQGVIGREPDGLAEFDDRRS
jgi:hypothetical protein